MEGVSLVQYSAHTIKLILTGQIVSQETQTILYKDYVMEEGHVQFMDHTESLGIPALVHTNTLKWNLTASKTLSRCPHPQQLRICRHQPLLHRKKKIIQ